QPLLPHNVNAPNIPSSHRAASFSAEWEQTLKIEWSYLVNAQDRATRHAEQNRRFAQHQAGDKVMVRTPRRNFFAKRTQDPRLLPSYIGPFSIERRIGKSTYQLNTPAWWKIHPVFHVSRLRPFQKCMEDHSERHLTAPRGTDLPAIKSLTNHYHPA
uniref:Tf2-1-like SH3-like domain-containing protein n=1 Tax=Nicotiana tabacum TaxID=4097 RepID=A0A1S4CD24_TOBAC